MSCPKGKIRRSSYNKKAHLRRSYKRSSGKRVGSSYVSRTYVPSTCVRDTGKPGKTPSRQRILPPIGKKNSLRRHGYSTKKSASQRHTALDKAANESNPLEVLRRLNLVANYTAKPNVENVLRRDVRYMSKKYKQYKQNSRSKSKSKSRNTRKTRKSKSKSKSRKGKRRH